MAGLLGLAAASPDSLNLENVMRAIFLLFVLAVLALVCVAARGQEEGQEDGPAAARVLCEGGRVAAIQVAVKEPGVYTLRLPFGICGRSA